MEEVGEQGCGMSTRRGEKEVEAFARVMLAELDKKEHKGPWKGQGLKNALASIDEERDELYAELMNGTREAILTEAAHLAISALQAADEHDALPAKLVKGEVPPARPTSLEDPLFVAARRLCDHYLAVGTNGDRDAARLLARLVKEVNERRSAAELEVS